MIVLPFPPASLSGHNTGHWSKKRGDIAALRLIAKNRTEKAGISVPADGDIAIHLRFVPPNDRGDRVNFPNRAKPLIDGIADGLKVNDKRFLPTYEFADPEAPGRIEVFIPTNPQGELSSLSRQSSPALKERSR